MTDPSESTHNGGRQVTYPDPRTRILALAAATPDPPVKGGYTHGDPCPRCEAAVLAGRFTEEGEQFLECERCLYRPTSG